MLHILLKISNSNYHVWVVYQGVNAWASILMLTNIAYLKLRQQPHSGQFSKEGKILFAFAD